MSRVHMTVYPIITNCPICSKKLKITKLHCPHCHTTIENDFKLSKLASLSHEQIHFVETFLVCRGNIKEVEKELGVSYPTVRGKLNDIIKSLGYELPNKKTEVENRNIISMLEKGEMTPADAIKLLKMNRGYENEGRNLKIINSSKRR